MAEQVAANRVDEGIGSRTLGIVLSAVSMAVAANCGLEYLWWTAKYSALTGIPKLAEQWTVAGTRASLYGWSFLAFEAASLFTLFGVTRSRFLGRAGRFVASLTITAAGTGLLALALSVIKQSR